MKGQFTIHHHHDTPKAEAKRINALILAAPALLEALEFSVEYLAITGCYKALEKAREAIAKAKGGAA